MPIGERPEGFADRFQPPDIETVRTVGSWFAVGVHSDMFADRIQLIVVHVIHFSLF
jgi:hypothetical protein